MCPGQSAERPIWKSGPAFPVFKWEELGQGCGQGARQSPGEDAQAGCPIPTLVPTPSI